MLVARSQAGDQAYLEVRIHTADGGLYPGTTTTLNVQPQIIPRVNSLLSSHADMLKTLERGGNLTSGEPRVLFHKDAVTWVAIKCPE